MFFNSSIVTFFFARTKKNLTEKRKCDTLRPKVSAWLFFVASAELTARRERPLKKRHCLSEASLSFLGRERVKGRKSVATDLEAATRAFSFPFWRNKKERDIRKTLSHRKFLCRSTFFLCSSREKTLRKKREDDTLRPKVSACPLILVLVAFRHCCRNQSLDVQK